MKTQKLIKLSRRIVLIIVSFFIMTDATASNPLTGDVSMNDSSRLEPDWAFGVSPGGAFLGSYSFNVEYLLDTHHGIVFRSDYRFLNDDVNNWDMHVTGRSFTVNYRYHMEGGMDAFYLGAFTRLRTYTGDGSSESMEFNFTRPDYTLGLNLGKRWIWDNGFAVNVSLGYGYVYKGQYSSHESVEVNLAIDDFMTGNDLWTGLQGEISIGYAFNREQHKSNRNKRRR